MNDNIERIKDTASILDVASRYVELKPNGKEYKGLCPIHDEKTPSFTVTPELERFHCFGCKANGDVIDLVKQVEGITTAQAIERLKSETVGKPIKKKIIKRECPYESFKPIDTDKQLKSGELIKVFNPKSKKWWAITPESLYSYLPQGWFIRSRGSKGEKIFTFARYCKWDGGEGWVSHKFDDPRPIFGLEDNDKQVLVVEGSKAATAGKLTAGNVLNVVAWDGGTQAVEKVDWLQLENKRVILLPDNDIAGKAAMSWLYGHLKAIAKSVRMVIPPEDLPKGWDIADRKWANPDELIGFCKDNILEPGEEPETVPNADPQIEDDNSYEIVPNVVDIDNRQPVKVATDWRASLMYKDDGIKLQNNVHNAIVLLSEQPEIKGAFCYNEFKKEVEIIACTPWCISEDRVPRILQDQDATRATAWLERKGCKLNIPTVQKAIIAAAKNNRVNPVVDYLNDLKWDGNPRIDTMLSRLFGSGDTNYSRSISRRFLIGAAARALDPGCKMDTMLILEGPQGLKKSTAVAELFGLDWTTDELSDFGSKDAALQVQGVWCVEVAELATMNRSETNCIKAWLSRRVDRFRPPYGMNVINAPRQCVLIGTVNPEGGYLKDSTGARRFWPIACGSIKIAELKKERDQLWAEAVTAYKNGERWWLEGDEVADAETEQSERYDEDTWEDEIEKYLSTKNSVTIADILTICLDIPAGQHNQVQKIRAAKILQSKRWARKRRRVGGAYQWYYYRLDG